MWKKSKDHSERVFLFLMLLVFIFLAKVYTCEINENLKIFFFFFPPNTTSELSIKVFTGFCYKTLKTHFKFHETL